MTEIKRTRITWTRGTRYLKSSGSLWSTFPPASSAIFMSITPSNRGLLYIDIIDHIFYVYILSPCSSKNICLEMN